MQCKKWLAGHACLVKTEIEMRATVTLQKWTRNVLIRKYLQRKNNAAIKIQAAVRGFLLRKNLPNLINQLQIKKQSRAATIIQVK